MVMKGVTSFMQILDLDRHRFLEYDSVSVFIDTFNCLDDINDDTPQSITVYRQWQR